MSQTFDSSYTDVTDPGTLGWHQIRDAANHYTWGRDIQSTTNISNTIWSAGANMTGLSLRTAGSDTYLTGTQALLVYGPLDLSNYGAVVLTATYLLDVQPSDSFGVAASLDGTNFNILSTDSIRNPALDAEHTGTYNLSSYARRSGVWVAFYFISDPNSTLALGAFIQSMALRAVPLQKSYMPLISKQIPTPTPTPVPSLYSYSYTFDSGLPSDPDVISWGGTVQSTCSENGLGSSGSWGNPPSAMTLFFSPANTVCGTSPNVKDINHINYEYSADLYVYKNHYDARYGLIFAASDSTFSGAGPTFNSSGNYYLLKIKSSATDLNSIPTYQFQEVSGGSSITRIPETNFPTALTPGTWNTFKVRHVGNTFTIFLNGAQLGTTVSGDPNWDTSQRKFGIYSATKDDNSGNPSEVFFDNVKISPLP